MLARAPSGPRVAEREHGNVIGLRGAPDEAVQRRHRAVDELHRAASRRPVERIEEPLLTEQLSARPSGVDHAVGVQHECAPRRELDLADAVGQRADEAGHRVARPDQQLERSRRRAPAGAGCALRSRT